MATRTVDPYVTLGVPAAASHAQAARAHRRLAKRFHPDVNHGPDAAERMRRINEAWWILSNPARRARYDAERGAPSAAAAWAGSRAGYGPRTRTATWTTWPENRRSGVPRARRPEHSRPVEHSFGNRPAVVVAVWVVLGVIFFIGSWLGSLAP